MEALVPLHGYEQMPRRQSCTGICRNEYCLCSCATIIVLLLILCVAILAYVTINMPAMASQFMEDHLPEIVRYIGQNLTQLLGVSRKQIRGAIEFAESVEGLATKLYELIRECPEARPLLWRFLEDLSNACLPKPIE